MDRIEEAIYESRIENRGGKTNWRYVFSDEELENLIELVAKEAFQAGIEREHNPFDNPNFDKWFNQVSDTLNLNE